MKASVGKNLEAVLRADNSQPETCVQVNTLKTDSHELEQVWSAEGVQFTPHSWLKGCYTLRNTGNLEKLPSFQQGLFQVQDPAARLSVAVLELKPGMRVLDLCAAPGGKSMAAAMAMENRGEIISCDLHGGKLPQIERAAQRLGVNIVTTMENNGTNFRPEFGEAFDAVIADVPCSGLGVIRKKPDIRYKELSGLEVLPTLQSKILKNAAAYVKPGGQVLYSTCTILKRENEAVVQDFLQSNAQFTAEELSLPEQLTSQNCGMLSLLQGVHDCDGFFLCRMRRRS
jgi:16S rRNA (cytosine967-C5)-methyltransferase